MPRVHFWLVKPLPFNVLKRFPRLGAGLGVPSIAAALAGARDVLLLVPWMGCWWTARNPGDFGTAKRPERKKKHGKTTGFVLSFFVACFLEEMGWIVFSYGLEVWRWLRGSTPMISLGRKSNIPYLIYLHLDDWCWMVHVFVFCFSSTTRTMLLNSHFDLVYTPSVSVWLFTPPR